MSFYDPIISPPLQQPLCYSSKVLLSLDILAIHGGQFAPNLADPPTLQFASHLHTQGASTVQTRFWMNLQTCYN